MLTDQGYRVRTRAEEHEFFRLGRVFAMLWSETAGGTNSANSVKSHGSNIYNAGTVQGRYGEEIPSQIRRFVIVRVNRSSHYVEAW
jgi:hypothetical protein